MKRVCESHAEVFKSSFADLGTVAYLHIQFDYDRCKRRGVGAVLTREINPQQADESWKKRSIIFGCLEL